MSTYHLNYYGQAKMDRRFTRPMLPWVISELQQRNHIEKVILTIDNEELIVTRYQPTTTDESNSQMFHQQLTLVARATACLPDKTGFAYLYRESHDAQYLQLHFFQADDPCIVNDLISTTTLSNRPAPIRSLSSATLTGIDGDISPCSSQYFEVLYIGKIKVSHKKVPDSFIDDALEKFHRHELEKVRDSNKSHSLESEKISSSKIPMDVLEQGVTSQNQEVSFVNAFHSDSSLQDKPFLKQRSLPLESSIQIPLKNTQSGNGDTNRTMVFQVGRSELRLISPDRKQIFLHKSLKDVASCIQGLKNTEHLGFICRENALDCYISYIFKCESETVADELVSAITQAFIAAADAFRKDRSPQPLSCEHCPMIWYHKLCIELEGLGNDRRALGFILNKINSIPEDDYSYLSVKLRNPENYSSVKDQLCYLMSVLRVYCQTKQSRHVHDTPENRHEFLNQYLGGTTLFTKAKKSLASSFDQLLKRKGSKDDIGHSVTRELSLPVISHKDDASPDSPEVRSCFDEEVSHKTSPMLSIFLKVGSTQKHSPSREMNDENNEPTRQSGSWRQAIFNRVVSPNKSPKVTLMEPCSASSTPQRPAKLEPAHLRELWKKAINQQLLLIRMEKENARLKARQEEASLKRIKLNYDELSTHPKEVNDVWDLLISKESKIQTECDTQMLLQAILRGVPKSKRGEVWQFLADQYSLRNSFTADLFTFPNYNTSYENLLKKLTSHQHSILIDLGRTFPENPYFSTTLGPGQLALFNLLKAYSLLDPELGYCQGLSFIAGVLLLHVTETEAFNLLKHLMFVRGLRRRFLPDMQGLQVVLYQLNRLVHDNLPLLDKLLDSVEVPPTLYAAPWALTLFASQFPLGFVVKVFDLVFIEGPDAFFKIALAILFEHNEQMQKCESFETIMEYMKEQLTQMNSASLEKIFRNAFSLNITKQLREYEVEYHVLQEEMPKADDIEKYKKLDSENKQLQSENQNLQQILEEHKVSLKQEKINGNRLTSQVRGLEVSVKTLGNFVLLILDKHPQIDVPDDVRRIADQIRNSNSKSVPLRVLGEDHRPPLKAALSSPNLTTRFSGMSLFNKTQHKKDEVLLCLREDDKEENNDLLISPEINTKPSSTPKLISSKSAFELGTTKTNDLNKKQEVLHPLDSCSVSIKYSGTRELPSLRNRKDDSKN